MVTRNILNNSTLTKVEKEPKSFWEVADVYEYRYFGEHVAEVTFNGAKCEVGVEVVHGPWAYVKNNNREFFAKISVVESQMHGVNIIDLENLQSMFLEMITNEDLQRGKEILTKELGSLTSPFTVTNFVKMFEDNIIQATQSMGSVFKTTYPMWNSKGQKK